MNKKNAKSPKSRTIAVRNVMRANRGVNTKPELRMRSLVHKAGLRYSINVRPEQEINRRADLVFRSAKVAVFIHGCFWHGCSKHFVAPKINRKYWNEKILRNRQRDRETRRFLSRKGWQVLVYWEHQDFDYCVDNLVACIVQRRKQKHPRNSK